MTYTECPRCDNTTFRVRDGVLVCAACGRVLTPEVTP